MNPNRFGHKFDQRLHEKNARVHLKNGTHLTHRTQYLKIKCRLKNPRHQGIWFQFSLAGRAKRSKSHYEIYFYVFGFDFFVIDVPILDLWTFFINFI